MAAGTRLGTPPAAGGDILATVVGVGLAAIGATGVLAQLQKAFHVIWDVRVAPERSGLGHTLRVRVLSLLLSLVVVSGFVFALVFKVLPNVRIPWRPAVVGAVSS